MLANTHNLKHILLVGYSRAAEAYIDRIMANPQWGYVVRGILDDNVPRGAVYKGVKVLGSIDNLLYILPENKLDEIVSIVLEIGDLSMIIPKYVEDIYSVIVKDTRFEHTELVIETVEGQGVCRQCKRAFPIVKNEGYCPRCGKRDADIISGRDFIIKEVVVP